MTTQVDTQGTAGGDTGSDERGRVGETLEAARTRASEAYETARERTSAAYEAARERASGALETARDGASRAGQRTADSVDANPMAALIGGLALGALAGALLPTSRREAETLGDLGRRINDTAREAAQAARQAGTEQLGELGLTKDGAREKVGDLASQAATLVSSSATAAVQAVRGQEQ